MNRKQIFISHADEDVTLKNFIFAQEKNHHSPYDFVEISAEDPDDPKWQTQCRSLIKECDGVLVLVTKNTKVADSELWEVACAKQEGIPCRGIWGHTDNKPEVLPENLEDVEIDNWTWENIQEWIDSLEVGMKMA